MVGKVVVERTRLETDVQVTSIEKPPGYSSQGEIQKYLDASNPSEKKGLVIIQKGHNEIIPYFTRGRACKVFTDIKVLVDTK